MTASEFKEAWDTDEFFRWTEFPLQELEKTDLSVITKDFLEHGFPEDAAPFLSFGLRTYDSQFYSMATVPPYSSYHDLGEAAAQLWLFGSDGNGNPICLDAGKHDRVVILDHEDGFRPMTIMNNNVIELAHCLLQYKAFINKVNEDKGEDGFIESKYTRKHISMLISNLEEINPLIFDESEFWDDEVFNLLETIGQ